ncbi:MAG: YlqD family protein, partial [Candidatus Margulisiibacteriota bacterium]
DLEQRRHISSQLEIERKNFQNAVRSFEQKIQEAKALQVGTQYVQGAVEGFVSVKEGDNLYQKLGGVELIVKDGIVQKIGRIPPDIR